MEAHLVLDQALALDDQSLGASRFGGVLRRSDGEARLRAFHDVRRLVDESVVALVHKRRHEERDAGEREREDADAAVRRATQFATTKATGSAGKARFDTPEGNARLERREVGIIVIGQSVRRAGRLHCVR